MEQADVKKERGEEGRAGPELGWASSTAEPVSSSPGGSGGAPRKASGGLGSGAAAAPVPCPAAGERPRGTEPAASSSTKQGLQGVTDLCPELPPR